MVSDADRDGVVVETESSPDASRERISGATGLPSRTASTVCATSWYSATRWYAWISTSVWNVGGALRSRTLFCVPRRLASSSESVTVCIPPTRSERVGFNIRFSSVLPCAVAMS